jgi:SAM-dependent methyltransferase
MFYPAAWGSSLSTDATSNEAATMDHQHAHVHHRGCVPHEAGTALSPAQWDAIYRDAPRWDLGAPQSAFRILAESGGIAGRVLDVGCGTGEHVLMCAALGLDATGVDLSRVALQAAADKARARGLTARFIELDVRHLAELDQTFDTVLDSGLFVHVYDDIDDRSAYLDGLRSVLRPGGRYFMLCFRGQPAGSGHDALTLEQLIAAFADGWQVDSIEPTTLRSTADPDGIAAWLVTLTRT